MATKKPITESVETYPAGRGRIVAIIKKRIPPKTKKYKHKQPHYTHTRIQMNPQNIVIAEYLDTNPYYNQKYIYLFPQAKRLTYQEREELALSLLATLPYYKQLTVNGNNNKPSKIPIFLTQTQRAKLKRKWRKYQKWRKKHQ